VPRARGTDRRRRQADPHSDRGEPLLRPDIFTIAEAARDAGLRPVMAPNGTLVTAAAAARMKSAGIGRISISIDFPDAAEHDRFRGCAGAFRRRPAGHARRPGRRHRDPDQLDHHALERGLPASPAGPGRGARRRELPPLHAGATGRGKDLAADELDPDDYERALNWIYDAQRSSPLFFKPTDVPHYWRVMRQRARADGTKLEAHPHSHGGSTR